jgi:PAT family beta-lactamase induction signal transducer AmpG
VLASVGFRVAAGILLVLLSGACIPTVLLRERPGERLLPWMRGTAALVAADRTPLAFATSVRWVARSVLARPSVRGLVVWISAYLLSGCLGILMTASAVRDHGFRQAEYSLLGALALGPNLIGAMAGGRLADRRGRAPVVVGALILGALSWTGFGLLSTLWAIKGVWVVQALAAAFASGALLTVLTAFFMDLAEPGIAATQFAICMALGNLGSVLGRASAGALEARFPLATLALAAGAVLAVLAIWTAKSAATLPATRRV